MGVMDKFLNYMKLNDEEDEGFYDDDYMDDEEEVEPVKKFGAAKNRQDVYKRQRRVCAGCIYQGPGAFRHRSGQ